MEFNSQMNEMQRQHYLSALGIDTYMPRWQLPFAPVSIPCEIPASISSLAAISPTSSARTEIVSTESRVFDVSDQNSIQLSPTTFSQDSTNNLISDIFDSKKTSVQKSSPISAADILAQLDSKPINIQAFTLSVWRPFDGMMVVDSRNSKLALPTELLLSNILRSVFLNKPIQLNEDILRWPMIENSFAKRTANDARVGLQTWLSVQQEIKPVQYLWLMGSNSATYFLADDNSYDSSIFQCIKLDGSAINALMLPSLNEILQKQTLKQKLYKAIRRYHSV